MLVLAVTLSLLIGAYVRRSEFDAPSLLQSRPIKIMLAQQQSIECVVAEPASRSASQPARVP